MKRRVGGFTLNKPIREKKGYDTCCNSNIKQLGTLDDGVTIDMLCDPDCDEPKIVAEHKSSPFLGRMDNGEAYEEVLKARKAARKAAKAKKSSK